MPDTPRLRERPTIPPEEGEESLVAPVMLVDGGFDDDDEIGPMTAQMLALEELPTGSLGRYVVIGELGRGGMGRILSARDPSLGRIVAVKVVRNPMAVDPATLERFVEEARITAGLEHPGIVPVHDIGLIGTSQVYFVMKRVEGTSLASILIRLANEEPGVAETWTKHRLLTAFVQVCDAIAYAHSQGVLHRDLKPANIMMGEYGEVLVLDWGVAQLLERIASGAAQRGVGTPSYMAPEQARHDGEAPDGRADVFSLGAILYDILTLEPAFPGHSAIEVIFKVQSGQLADPRHAAPHRGISEEIAGICMRALSAAPKDRFPSAEALATAVRDYLDGSKKRALAEAHMADARTAWQRFEALDKERRRRTRDERTELGQVDPWTPLDDKKELLAIRRRLQVLGPERLDAFGEMLTACERALAHAPDMPEARELLADAWLHRYREAEADRSRTESAWFAGRVRAWDDGRHAAALSSSATLTLTTDPAGAEVVCERFVTEGLVWELADRQVLGPTPLHDVELPAGSYLLTIKARGRRDTRYPVLLRRGSHHTSGDRPLPLLSEAAIGQDWIYVPAGAWICGGDRGAPGFQPQATLFEQGFLITELPVSMADYRSYLDALHARGPAQAWKRVPRQGTGMNKKGGQYWKRPARGEWYEVPDEDRDGDIWQEKWPVAAISWKDAVAYSRFRAARDKLPIGLPTERQWEKAARGVDGRVFPWGDGFDATLCKTTSSRPGRPTLEPVGSFPTDVSVYGVRDMAGLVCEMTADPSFEGDPDRRPTRGGSWRRDAGYCRCASRFGAEPWLVDLSVGFRLVRSLPGQGSPSGLR
jgi:eukaryotic-like serine/threonine-protein kinase